MPARLSHFVYSNGSTAFFACRPRSQTRRGFYYLLLLLEGVTGVMYGTFTLNRRTGPCSSCRKLKLTGTFTN